MSERESRRALDRLRRLSDEDLAGVAADGDESAARVLLERFEEPLYRYTVAVVRDPDLAREATWSALFEAARAVRSGEYSEPVKPWLFRVAHTAADVAGGRPEGPPGDEAAGPGNGDAAVAERIAAAAPEDHERLEDLVERLDGLPRRDRESLLLRELVGLEYVGIATVTGARAAASRQSVFRARLALQDDPEALTEHCDEIRAAMSKAESGVRERRSIAIHLETCPVCEEFARQLETRPDDLRNLFPGPDEPLAAELVPPLPPVTTSRGRPDSVYPEPAYDEAAYEESAAPEWATEVDEGRRRRRLLVPALIALVLIGAGVAAALALNDNGGGDKGKARAAREGAQGSVKRGAAPGAAGGSKQQRAAGGKRSSGANGSAKSGATSSSGGGEKAAPNVTGAGGGRSSSAAGGSARGSSGKSGSATRGSATGGSSAGANSAAGKSSGGTSGSTNGEEAPSEAGGSTAGESTATAGGTGSEQGALATNGQRATAPAGAVPRTGLDVVLVIAMGFLLLALGLSVRRVYAEI